MHWQKLVAMESEWILDCEKYTKYHRKLQKTGIRKSQNTHIHIRTLT